MAASPRENTLALLRRIVSALDDKKATDIRVIEMGEKSGVTDFYVIATGTSDPHLRALRNELERVLDEDKVKVLGVESQPESGWTVVDAFDVIVHLLSPAQRNNFRLEQLWKDGKAHPVAEFIAPVVRGVSDQAVSISGLTKKPVVEKKSAVAKAPAKKSEPKILVKKAVLKRTAAEKSKPASEKKLPGRKLTAKAKAEAAAEAAPKKAVKKSPAKKAAEKKVIAKKEAKAAKTVRAIAKAKAAPVKKSAATKAPAKAGVITRKAGRA